MTPKWCASKSKTSITELLRIHQEYTKSVFTEPFWHFCLHCLLFFSCENKLVITNNHQDNYLSFFFFICTCLTVLMVTDSQHQRISGTFNSSRIKLRSPCNSWKGLALHPLGLAACHLDQQQTKTPSALLSSTKLKATFVFSVANP